MKLFSKEGVTDKEFDLFRRLINDKSGIYLSDAKRQLLRARLSKRITQKGFKSFLDYYRYLLHEDKDGSELVHLLDAISTNKTSFFRELEHFKFMQDVILPIIEQNRMQDREFFLRIWSAGCSTGEETYSIAIALKEYFGAFTPQNGRILGTDISNAAIEKAKRGEYDSKEISSLPKSFVESYLDPVQKGKNPIHKMKKNLMNIVVFRRLNLLAPRYPFKHQFDLIFCRNVLMYFNKESQEMVLNKLYGALKDGGYLFTGHAENLIGIKSKFKIIRHSIYLKEQEQAPRKKHCLCHHELERQST